MPVHGSSSSAIALGEFVAGFADERDAALVEIRRHFALLPFDETFALIYRPFLVNHAPPKT
jgi:hypothetical protein